MARSTSAIEAGKEKAAETASAAVTELKSKAKDAKSAAKSKVSDARESAADRIEAEAERLESAAEEMTDGTPHAEFTAKAARAVQKTSDHIRESSLTDLLEDVNEFARRHPVASASLALAAGVALGRFWKATAPQNRHEPDLTTHHLGTSDRTRG